MGVTLGATALLCGCSDMVLFNPKGPIGDSEKFVITAAFLLMLIVVIPVIIMAFWFAWKFRASNTQATYAPKWSHSPKIEWTIWLVPIAIVTALGILAWSRTYHLDPYKPIQAAAAPVRIEAVSLDWKWLFIYPDQDIATINRIVFPANVPLNFRITSDTVMTSFFIPQLGSQIYAMAGMQTRLHLMAHEPGTYAGQNQQFSGSGYADMTFEATATSAAGFSDWVQEVKQASGRLDRAGYESLRKPSSDAPATYFSSVEADLFDHVLRKYMPASDHSGPMAGQSGTAHTQTRPVEEK